MSEVYNSATTPHFNSLAAIMEHFSKVPFDKFKRDIDQWFYKSLKDGNVDLNSFNWKNESVFPDHLKLLVEQIYREAEILQNQQDAEM